MGIQSTERLSAHVINNAPSKEAQWQKRYSMKAKMVDVMKGIIIISLILLAGLTSAYTPDSEATLNETMSNETTLNETMSNETTLNETMSNETTLNETMSNETIINETTQKELTILPVITKLKNPFKAGSDLSQFGKQQVYDL